MSVPDNSSTRLGVYLAALLAVFVLIPTPAWGKCTAPSGLLPKDGTTGVALNETLRWSTDGTAEALYLYHKAESEPVLGKDPSIKLAGKTTSYTSEKPLLAEKTVYYWYVVYESSSCSPTQIKSVTQKFTTTTCPGVPTNSLPKDGASVAPNVTLSWSSTGATSYDVLASINGGTETTLGSNTSTSFPYSFPEGASVIWRVRGNTTNGCGSRLSPATKFTVISCKFDRPEQVGPANASSQPTSVKFSWKSVTGAGDYGLVTSVDGATPSESRVGNVTTTEQTFASGVKVVWFVRAYPTNGCAPVDSTQAIHFVTAAGCPSGAPKLTSPEDGAGGLASPVLFKWDGVAGAEAYELFAAQNGSGSFISQGKTTGTSLSRSVSGVVLWFVEALFPGSCPSGKSEARKIEVVSTACPKDGPVLVSPADGASVTSPVAFEWTSVAGALKYSLQIKVGGSTGDFKEIVSTTSPKASVPLGVGEFEWRVVAFPDKCDAVTSSVRRIAVKEGTTCASNKAPELLSPPNGEVSGTDVVKFVWTLVDGAAGYELQISQDGGGSWKTLGTTPNEGIVVSLPQGKFAWRVLAQFAGCPALTSLPRALEVLIETCSSTPAAIIAPPLGSTVPSPVLLQWSAVAGADFYRVFASIDGGPTSNVSGSVTGTSYEAALPSGTIVWYVEAVSRTCASTFSAKSKFIVQKSGSCPTVGPKLVSPLDGATGVSRIVTFVWEPVAGAVAYEVFVSIDGGAPASIGQTKGFTLEREMKGEKITWFVHALSAGCEAISSIRATFALASDDGCAIAVPSRILPTDNSSVVSPVEFQWTSSGEGTYYRLWVVRDGEKEVVLAETLDTNVTRHMVPGSYTWLVEAFRKGCRTSVKSARGRFAVIESQGCKQDAPVPLSPTDGSTQTNPEVTFNWSPVDGAIAYELWLSRGDGVETLVRVTRLTSETLVLGEGKLAWFVRALFDGCQATRSQALTFLIDPPDNCAGRQPFLLSPPIDELVELSNPVYFSWTPATGGSGPPTYSVFVSINDADPLKVAETLGTSIVLDLPTGRMSWFVRADRPGCPPLNSSRGVFVVTSSDDCRNPQPPAVRAVLEARSGRPYTVSWLPGPNAGAFIIEESPDPAFGNVESKIVSEPHASFVHDVATPTPFFYRVFAISGCDEKISLPSETIRVIVMPKPTSATSKVDDVHPLDTSDDVTLSFVIPGGAGKTTSATTFTASMSQPWMTVSPSSGTIPPEGITLEITANTEQMGPGANTGSLVVTTSDGAGRTTSSGSTSTPVSVSLVSPVSPTSKSGPKPESLIIAAVGHATGFNSQWQSDVRISNIAAQTTNYLLFFTPSGQAGTGTVKQASVTVRPGETVALDDVVKSWFGIGADGASATGTLEIRPQSNAITTSASSSLANGTSLASGTVASSRTYNLSTGGTFGQFIPPVAFSSFAGKGEPISLQQVSQSAQFRTNIGVAEGAGEEATVQFTVYSNDGNVLGQWDESLKPGEQRQFDQIIAQKGLSLEGGRVEVEVVSETGKITAYASTVDNQTGDPTFIAPVNRKSVASESKLVVPGVADLDNGIASWRTDVRLFNAGDSSETVTLAYYAQGSTTPAATKQVTIAAGGVLEANDLLKSTFGVTNSGGALHIETDGGANIVPTARTYNRTESGTYGQFIPAVSASKGLRLGSAPLQLLQVEQSAGFRTNLGLAELSGNQATVEVTAAVPGALIAPIKQYTLGPNEFRQVNVILNDMGIPEAYNARVSIRVVSGGGSVSAYASVVDNATQDPTYVPAQ